MREFTFSLELNVRDPARTGLRGLEHCPGLSAPILSQALCSRRTWCACEDMPHSYHCIVCANCSCRLKWYSKCNGSRQYGKQKRHLFNLRRLTCGRYHLYSEEKKRQTNVSTTKGRSTRTPAYWPRPFSYDTHTYFRACRFTQCAAPVVPPQWASQSPLGCPSPLSHVQGLHGTSNASHSTHVLIRETCGSVGGGGVGEEVA